MALLDELWELVNLRKNHLLPMVKANGYATAGSRRRKWTYGRPRTAYQRLLDYHAMDKSHAEALESVHWDLNPAAITRRVNAIPNQLINRATMRAPSGDALFGEQIS